MPRLKTVQCAHCGASFDHPVNKVNEAERNGWKQFCTSKCLSLARTSSQIFPCTRCGTPVTVQKNVIETSISGLFFCGHTCSAIYSNTGRKHTQETKEKISRAVVKYRVAKGLPILAESALVERVTTRTTHQQQIEKPCCVCGVKFKPLKQDNIACSKACGQIHQFGSLPLTREELITEIQCLAQTLGHTPSSKQVTRKITVSAQKFFGSWNKTMVSLGYTPNAQSMRRRCIRCTDGHLADSASERIIDDWFYRQGFKHERFRVYPEGKFTCDFYLPDQDLWVEYFGLAGQHRAYDQTTALKRDICLRNNLKLIEIIPEMLYPTVKLTLDLFQLC